MSDSKMRELVDRMAEMSPEPPPYPDQVPMSAPRPRRRDPVVIFAGAAAVVLGIALVPVLLSGNGDDPGPIGSTPPPTQSTVPSDTTVPGPGLVTLHDTVVYLVHSPAGSATGDPALVAFATQVAAPSESDVVEATLRMLDDPSSLTLPDGYEVLIPDEVEVVDVRRPDGADNVLIIEMNEAFLAGAGGLLADFTMLNQLIYTATATTPGTQGIDQVQFIVDNQQVTAFGSDGLDLSSSVGREDFRDNLNSIIITEPLLLGGDGLPQIEGVTRVFEGTVSVDIVESESGEVVYSDFTTATCGTGCWGSFTISLDTPELTPERTVLVYSVSAKDGSRTDVVRVPVNPDPFWNFLPTR
jgi:spore germination protein GerM